MPITRFEVTAEEDFAGGQDFGAGPYRRIAGIAHGTLDPADPRLAAIVDLGLAPRDEAGRVAYATEICLLRPADPRRANGRLLCDITNRGRKMIFAALFEGAGVSAAEQSGLRSAASAGNAIPLRQGTTLVWNGWDPEAPRGSDNLRIVLPVLPGITGMARDEFVFGTRINPPDRPTAPLSYPVADHDQARARLTVRRTRDGVAREIHASGWAYAGDRAIRLLPEGTAFEPGSIYDVRYPATGARPLGAAFAATRDLIAALRHGEGEGNPLADLPVRSTFAVGISQAGRYLRHHLDLGMNADAAGRRVFDGVLAHIAGAGRVFINDRFAQPDRTACWHEDYDFPEVWFPISVAPSTDPLSGRSDALLRGDPATWPRLMEANTSTEYWQKGASLTHTDPAGARDLDPPPDVRQYLVAGTRHAGRSGATTARGIAHNPNNPHSASPLLRALLAALEDWVERDVAPPPSAVPRIADGTLLPAETVLAGFPRIPGALLPPRATPVAPIADWVEGTRAPAPWRVLVPAVDADGNEIAGVRLPDIAVPRGTHTGWNLYAGEGLQSELADREGSFLAFPATPEPADPRAPLSARYPSRAAHVAAVRAAAEALVAARLLLAEDVPAYVAAAEAAPG